MPKPKPNAVVAEVFTAEAPIEAEAPSVKARQTLIAFAVSIIDNAKKLEPQLHELCMQIAKHAETYGDATPAQFVYEQMPKSQRRMAMAAWWKEYTQIVIQDRKDGVKVKLDRSKEWRIEAGNDNPFFNMSEAAVSRPMGEIDAVTLLSKRLDSLEEKITLWEAATEDEKIKIFKLGVNPIHERDQLRADIAVLTRSRQAA